MTLNKMIFWEIELQEHVSIVAFNMVCDVFIMKAVLEKKIVCVAINQILMPLL